MCLIIHKTKDVKDSDFKVTHKHILEAGVNGNNDGIGIMYVNNGRVKFDKAYFDRKPNQHKWSYDSTAAQKQAHWFKSKYESLDTYVVHLRYGTHGLNNKDMCHPFRILTKGERLYSGKPCEYDLFMMHNGIISVNERVTNNSDTWHFAKDYLRPILLGNPELLQDLQIQHMLGEFIGGSKLVFLDSTDRITYINKDMGTEKDGYWFSNQDYLPSVFKKQYSRIGYTASNVIDNPYYTAPWKSDDKFGSYFKSEHPIHGWTTVERKNIENTLLYCDEYPLDTDICPRCNDVDCLSLYQDTRIYDQNYLVCDSCDYCEKLTDSQTTSILHKEYAA